MSLVKKTRRNRRLKSLDEMPPPNPRDAQWRRPVTAGQRLKQAIAAVAIAYGAAGALVLTALLSLHGPGTVLNLMGNFAAETWRLAANLAATEA